MKIKATLNSRFIFLLTGIILLFSRDMLWAQEISNLPPIGQRVTFSEPYTPMHIKGVTVYPEDHLRLDFIVDSGESTFSEDQLNHEAQRLIRYFMAALTVPQDQLWVNLSPYEAHRIMSDELSHTELGRDLLSQDYILKQFTASLLYPEEKLGDSFWHELYAQAKQKLGTRQFPINTFNKVWIVPEAAHIVLKDNTVYVTDSYLKVMLEDDYLALESNKGHTHHGVGSLAGRQNELMQEETKELMRTLIIPIIEREVNTGKHFSTLRQIFHSTILAAWYKQNINQSALTTFYADKNMVTGIDLSDKELKAKMHQRYVMAFEKGVYQYIREDYDSESQVPIPTKYVSGGIRGQITGLNTQINGVLPNGFLSSNTLRIATRLSQQSTDMAMNAEAYEEQASRWVEDQYLGIFVNGSKTQKPRDQGPRIKIATDLLADEEGVSVGPRYAAIEDTEEQMIVELIRPARDPFRHSGDHFRYDIDVNGITVGYIYVDYTAQRSDGTFFIDVPEIGITSEIPREVTYENVVRLLTFLQTKFLVGRDLDITLTHERQAAAIASYFADAHQIDEDGDFTIARITSRVEPQSYTMRSAGGIEDTFTFLYDFPTESSSGNLLHLARKEGDNTLYLIKKAISEDAEQTAFQAISEFRRLSDQIETMSTVYQPLLYTAGPNTWAGSEDGWAVVYPFLEGITMDNYFRMAAMGIVTDDVIERLDLVMQAVDIFAELNEIGLFNVWDVKARNIEISPSKQVRVFDYQQMRTYPSHDISMIFFDAIDPTFSFTPEELLESLEEEMGEIDESLRGNILTNLAQIQKGTQERSYQTVRELQVDLKATRDLIAIALERSQEEPDAALLANNTQDNLGGIDLNAANLRFQVVGQSTILNMQGRSAQLNAPVTQLTPMIVTITPYSELPALLPTTP